MTQHIKCLIIGSGPAGYTAAIYASRANLSPVLYEGLLTGGQLTQTHIIENYPGFPEGISGFDLMDQMREQVLKFGAEIRSGLITSLNASEGKKIATDEDGNEIEADAVIIATGASAKYLGIEAEQKYMGRGVSACATCDGFFFRKKNVLVVGGGDTALTDAVYLSSIANKVYIAVRKDYFRASKVLADRIAQIENIEVLYRHELRDLCGEECVEKAVLQRNDNNETVEIAVDGVFIAIGHKPSTEILGGEIELDENGFVKTKEGTQETSVEGVFVAGDVCDPKYKQAITAAAAGCRAALDAEKYLMQKG